MKTNESVIATTYLIDVEDAHLSINREEAKTLNRSQLPFSNLKTGKFRKMFNRHDFTSRSV